MIATIATMLICFYRGFDFDNGSHFTPQRAKHRMCRSRDLVMSDKLSTRGLASMRKVAFT